MIPQLVQHEQARRLSIRLVMKRLEESPLYQRREQAGRAAQVLARLAALWYLSDDFQPRYHAKPS
jgi:hypothetical protein